jgi:nicotinate-nucleotide adenylyltransferase
MDIGLFGGSFNPPHTGHLWLTEAFRTKGNLDLVWVLVAPDPPHKDEASLVAYEHRLEMTKMTFHNSFGVEVNLIEESLPKPTYTYRTVEALKAKHPGTTFWLCIGEDSFYDLPNWKEPERLLRNVNLLVARRGGYVPTSALPNADWIQRLRYIDIEPLPTSSTDIRTLVSTGASTHGLLQPDIEQYIYDHRLYRK